MRIKLCLLLIAYLLFSTPVTSHAATASIEDDIDLSFILGDEFKNPSKNPMTFHSLLDIIISCSEYAGADTYDGRAFFNGNLIIICHAH